MDDVTERGLAAGSRSGPSRNSDVVSRAIGGETVLVPVRGNVGDLDHVYTLSPVASFIWNALDGKSGVDDLTSRVVEEFEVDRERAHADVVEFLDDLDSVGLIENRK